MNKENKLFSKKFTAKLMKARLEFKKTYYNLQDLEF
ncbi:hypothetical protein SAMN05878391_2020 [Salinicoccus kekensis]|uniref:Uncharacterized protein n=1 Tax=Salinicoccus kekensis TaxID=714307 RepID=A0A285UNT9_9STAP|nr:hypothetical protein SAMN05878391_2020 [Salinicoccus kekensis]